MLKLYYDLMSQPSRALYILLKSTKTPFVDSPISLRNGAHFSAEFESINRFKKVPAIDHNGFCLSESVAIVQYMKQEKLIPENIFPSDSKIQAKVNEFLAWQHIGIRAPCALFFIYTVLEPMLTGQPAVPRKVEKQKDRMMEALDVLEEKWLGSGNKYLVGNTLTVADIFGCCEIEQPRMAGYDPREGRPNIAAWMERVKSDLNPYYGEAHAIVDKIAKKRELGDSKL